MLKEEINDFRNKSNQLHETLKIKVKNLQEARRMYSIFKKKIKASISEKAQRPHLHITITENELTEKNDSKANHTSPTNQILSNNHSDHRDVHQLTPESSSSNNFRTTSAQAETSTIAILKLQLTKLLEKR